MQEFVIGHFGSRPIVRQNIALRFHKAFDAFVNVPTRSPLKLPIAFLLPFASPGSPSALRLVPLCSVVGMGPSKPSAIL